MKLLLVACAGFSLTATPHAADDFIADQFGEAAGSYYGSCVILDYLKGRCRNLDTVGPHGTPTECATFIISSTPRVTHQKEIRRTMDSVFTETQKEKLRIDADRGLRTTSALVKKVTQDEICIFYAATIIGYAQAHKERLETLGKMLD